jgi:hypothetical protein
MVVLEGSERDSLDVELGDQIAQVHGAILYDVDSSSKAKFMWEKGDRYQPIYGVFNSLDAAEQWAVDNGYEYQSNFGLNKGNFIRSLNDDSIKVRLPTVRNDEEYLDVHVFTDRYAILDLWTTVEAEPIEEYPILHKTYLSLME